MDTKTSILDLGAGTRDDFEAQIKSLESQVSALLSRIRTTASIHHIATTVKSQGWCLSPDDFKIPGLRHHSLELPVYASFSEPPEDTGILMLRGGWNAELESELTTSTWESLCHKIYRATPGWARELKYTYESPVTADTRWTGYWDRDNSDEPYYRQASVPIFLYLSASWVPKLVPWVPARVIFVETGDLDIWELKDGVVTINSYNQYELEELDLIDNNILLPPTPA